MLWALEQSQQKNRAFVPFGRLLYEIFYQGGMLEVLKMSKAVNYNQLGTMVGKYVNGSTLYNMHLVKAVIIMDTDLQESNILSNLMDNFPPICKQDPPDVRAHYVNEHWKAVGETIKYSDIPNSMYGGFLPVVSKKRKAKKKTTLEADNEEASEPQPKKAKEEKAKKEKSASQVAEVGYVMPTIQEEVEDLELVKIIEQRTRGKKSLGSSGSIPVQPKISKKKRTSVRKLRESQYILQEVEDVETIGLVTRELRNKKVADAAALQKAMQIAKETEIPALSILREDAGVSAQKVIEAAEEVLEMALAEAGNLLKISVEIQRVEASGTEEQASDAAAKDHQGKDSIHNASENIADPELSPLSEGEKNHKKGGGVELCFWKLLLLRSR